MVARTGDIIVYQAAGQAVVLLDIDLKAMPAPVTAQVEAAGGSYEATISAVLPGLTTAGRIIRKSTSACLFNKDAGLAVAR